MWSSVVISGIRVQEVFEEPVPLIVACIGLSMIMRVLRLPQYHPRVRQFHLPLHLSQRLFLP
jgi:hypothetical protein